MNRAHLSRRHLLRVGAGAMAAAGTLRRAALAYAERRVPLLGNPRWGHAVGDPRGSDITRAYGKAREGRFGRMFKDLPDYTPPDDVLVELAGAMVESRPAMSDVSDSSEGDNLAVPAGFVYLGQFIDHDMTRDTTPLGARKVDPHGITNFDTPFFDLGSIYGGGPRTDPQLYDPASPGRMLLDSHDGVLDLPRQPDGTAIIGDPRDDENLIICQLQIAFLQLHNAFLAEGRSFADAQQQTRWHFQWVIVHDFLPHIVGQELVDSLLLVPPRKGVIQTRNRFYRPRSAQRPMMPIEYSGAAYRFGHSMIRAEYEVHDGRTMPIFASAGADLRGSCRLPADLQIDWNYFFEIPGVGPPDDRNYARLIDTKLSLPLANLPQTVVAHDPGAILSLAARNLLRGKQLGVPAGQDVAAAMRINPLTNAELGLTDPRWGGKAPLWYYVLKEAELNGGERLGPVGGRIVAEVILGVIAADRSSYFNAKQGFAPRTPEFRMGDLLRFAGAPIVDPADAPEAAEAPEAPEVPEVPEAPELADPAGADALTGAPADPRAADAATGGPAGIGDPPGPGAPPGV